MVANEVDAILARFPGPVTLRVSRLKMLALLAGSLAFVVGGILLIVFVKDDQEAVIAGIASVLFFGACAVVGAVMLLPGAGSLTLDVGGLEVCSFFRRNRIAWPQAAVHRHDALASGRQQKTDGHGLAYCNHTMLTLSRKVQGSPESQHILAHTSLILAKQTFIGRARGLACRASMQPARLVIASGGPGMKTILVPTQNIAAMPSALELAVLLARRMGAYIEGFPLRVAIPPYIAAELTAGFTMAAYTEQRDEETTELRRVFETFMQKHGVPAGTTAERPACGWLAVASEDEGFIGSRGRAFDITVISRLGADSTSLHQRAIESGLFESGRPVLLAPPNAPAQIASNVMIHWNGSTEQARANAFAMPLLRLAERVTVLTVAGGQDVPGPSADDILGQLQHNGIAAKPIRVNLGTAKPERPCSTPPRRKAAISWSRAPSRATGCGK